MFCGKGNLGLGGCKYIGPEVPDGEVSCPNGVSVRGASEETQGRGKNKGKSPEGGVHVYPKSSIEMTIVEGMGRVYLNLSFCISVIVRE